MNKMMAHRLGIKNAEAFSLYEITPDGGAWLAVMLLLCFPSLCPCVVRSFSAVLFLRAATDTKCFLTIALIFKILCAESTGAAAIVACGRRKESPCSGNAFEFSLLYFSDCLKQFCLLNHVASKLFTFSMMLLVCVWQRSDTWTRRSACWIWSRIGNVCMRKRRS